MSRRKLIQTYQPDPDGPSYGRVVKSGDIMDIQEYVKRRIDLALRDLVMRTAAAPQVNGFDYSLPGGMTFRVAPGQATDVQGRSFENYPLDANTDLVIGAAPVANSRIDLIYATLVADQDAAPQLLPHRRLRTQLEYEQDAPEYDPVNYNVNTERRNAAVLAVRAGVVGAVPVAPAVGANEVALYQVRVDAGDVAVGAGKVTDVRNSLRSLYQLMQNVITLESSPAITNLAEQIDDRVAALLVDTSSVVKAYNDAAGQLTLSVPAEFIQDVVGAFITAGNAGITVNYDDTANTFTISLSVEELQDQVNALVAVANGVTKNYNDAGNVLTLSLDVEFMQDQIAAFLFVAANTGLSINYDDVANTLTLSGVAASGAAMGMQSAAHYTLVNGATNAATASTLFKRHTDGGGNLVNLGIGAAPPAVPTNGLGLQGNLAMSAKVTTYNGIATDGLGTAPIRKEIYLNQGVAVAYTAFSLTTSGASGFRVTVTLSVSGGTGGQIEVWIKYSDEIQAGRTKQLLVVSANGIQGGDASFTPRLPTDYSVVFTGVTGAPVYYLHIFVEQLG